jgi:D-tyrosyl-tRNA(Tyr) deacylase
MKVVLQRVNRASVSVDDEIVGQIERGLLILVGAGKDDVEEDVKLMADKSLHLRIFEDENGKMNLSCLDLGYEALIVSQFTLQADCRRGRRPSFTDAMEPDEAKRLYECFIKLCRNAGVRTETGVFGAKMNISLENWGPVTIIMDSKG